MTYHLQLRRVHNKQEHMTFFVIKCLVFACFVLLVFYTWITQQVFFLQITGIALIAAPAIAIVYSFTIFNSKCMAVQR